MPEQKPRSFALDSRTLAAHCAGQVLCLAPSALGRSFTLKSERPSGYKVQLSARSSVDMPPDSGPAVVERSTGVAIVSIDGPLEQRATEHLCGYSDGYDAIRERVCAALADPSVDALVLCIDSPGGVAAGLEEAVKYMHAEVEASGKPCFAYADELAGSAAYWIACGVADEVYLPPAGFVGSIGSRAAHYSEAGALEQEGIAPTLFAYPPGKTALASETPLGETGAARAMRDVKASAEAFIAAVAARRGLSADAVTELDADVLRGSAAVAAGLADGIASYEDVIALAFARASAARLTNEPAPDSDRMSGPQPPPAPPAPSNTGAPRMSLKTLAAALGLAADASAPAVEAAATPLIALASYVMRATGTTNPGDARGAFEGLAREAARVPELTSKMGQLEAQAEASTRRELLEQAVADNKLTPAEAWDWSTEIVNGREVKTKRPSEEFSAPHKNAHGEDVGRSLGNLRSHLGKLTPKSVAPTTPFEAKRRPEAGAVTEADRALAARLGKTPEAVAASREALFGGSAAGKVA